MAKAKQPRQESTPAQQKEVAFRAAEDVSYASRPSSTSAPSSSFGIKTSLVAIMNQLQLMCADFGSLLDHLSD